MEKVSIIIPTMNRPETLNMCLEKLQSFYEYISEIIIIDQSKIRIYEENLNVNKLIKSKINIIYQEKPSLTAARNLGLKYVTSEIIIFMDDDTIIDSDTIIQVIKTFKNKQIGLVTAIDILSNDAKQYKDLLGAIFLRKNLFKNNIGYVCKGSLLGRYPTLVNEKKELINTEWAMGYFFCIKKSIIEKYKIYFDEKLMSYAYPEDLDFTFRYCKALEAQGLYGVINRHIIIKHLGSEEYRIENDKALAMYVIHRVYLSYKLFKSPIYRMMLLWADLGEVIRRKLAKQSYKKIIKSHLLCFKYSGNLRYGIISQELLNLMR